MKNDSYNRVSIGVNDYQIAQRKRRICNSISILLLSVLLLNMHSVILSRKPKAVSISDMNEKSYSTKVRKVDNLFLFSRCYCCSFGINLPGN